MKLEIKYNRLSLCISFIFVFTLLRSHAVHVKNNWIVAVFIEHWNIFINLSPHRVFHTSNERANRTHKHTHMFQSENKCTSSSIEFDFVVVCATNPASVRVFICRADAAEPIKENKKKRNTRSCYMQTTALFSCQCGLF